MAAKKPAKKTTPKAATPNRGRTRSAAVNKGKQGAAMSSRRRPTGNAGEMRGDRTPGPKGNAGEMRGDRSGPGKPRQVYVEPGGLAGFARGVSQNFGRGVAEVGRQVSSVMPKGGGRQDPLAGNSLGRAVNAGKGKSWINR